MPTYTWTGIDNIGRKISGVEHANNYNHLKFTLLKQNILPIKITQKVSLAFWQNNKIATKHIATFIEQLAVLINANTPLITALNIISKDKIDQNLKSLIINCRNSILGGQSLYNTLYQYPQYFNEVLCSLVNVGEQSGTLDIVLNELAKYFAKTTLQKRKIIKALLYPATVLSITCIVTVILLLFVIPQFKTTYNSIGAQIPTYTQFIINLGDFFQTHWSYILCGIFSVAVCIRFLYKHSIKFRHYLEDITLKIPIVGSILTYGIIAQLMKSISLSFRSGIPLLKAIDISSNTIKNWRYQLAMHHIIKSIANGKTFHGAMEEQNIFPMRVIQLITLGEETGALDAMLEKIATIYNAELDHITDNLNNLLEPIIMLILGVLVGSLIIGMYLPIFRLGTAI